MVEALRQLDLHLNIFIPALLVPLSVATILLILRKRLHDIWTPAVDVYAVLLAAELVMLWEHDRLAHPAAGVELVQGTVTLLCITLPLFIGSLLVEETVIHYHVPQKGKHRGSRARKRTILLWASAVTIFAGQMALLMGQKQPQNTLNPRMESQK